MIIQLEAIRNDILTEINDIPDHLFNDKESANSWSVGQVLDHLHKIEVEITKAIKYMLTLPEQDPLPDKPLTITLDRSKKRTAPEAFIPSSQTLDKQEILSSLAQSRQNLLKLIDSIPPERDITRIGFKHRFFDVLSLKQWIEFIGYHEKRHLSQIIEIKASIINENV